MVVLAATIDQTSVRTRDMVQVANTIDLDQDADVSKPFGGTTLLPVRQATMLVPLVRDGIAPDIASTVQVAVL